MDKTSMTLGFLVGRQIAGQRKTAEKVPIAYLYNGVQLPPLPEWDTEAYPYVFYTNGFMGIGAGITCISGMEYYDNNGSYSFHYTGAIKYNVKDNGWGEPTVYSDTKSCAISAVKWANFDVLNSDGSVYLEATDPIPVYE